MDVIGVGEDEHEEVVDPFYIKQVEVFPIPKLEWDLPEEEDLQDQTVPIIERSKKWLVYKKKSKLRQAESNIQKGSTISKPALHIHCTDKIVACSLTSVPHFEPKI